MSNRNDKSLFVAESEIRFRRRKTPFYKLRGLKEFGSFRPVETSNPRFAFLFPTEYREKANSLYLALKNGVGYFGGVENVFRYALRRTSVFSIGAFGIEGKRDPDQVRAYTDALSSWLASTRERPDLVFIILPRNLRLGGPEYLLQVQGLASPRRSFVTRRHPEVIDDPSTFEWAVANIALGAFAKLGGLPWVVSGESADSKI